MSQRRSATAPIHLVVPGPINTLTGGFIYDRHVTEGLERAGRLGDLLCLGGNYPRPAADDLARDAEQLRALSDAGMVVIDGLALTALAQNGGAGAFRGRLIALIHHPLCDETGLSPDDVRTYFNAEKAALKGVSGCIVTSPATARRMRDFGLAADRIHVVIPGLDHPSATPRPVRQSGESVRLLCVASISPRKGQDILLDALTGLTDLNWRLDLIGARRDAEFADKIGYKITDARLADRARYLGEIDGGLLSKHYAAADLFVLPSHHEGFGMALTEAMAHGLPVVSTTAGAIPETVPEGAGVLVAPGDVDALAACLRHFIEDAAARSRASRIGMETAARMPSWAQTSEKFIAAVDTLGGLS